LKTQNIVKVVGEAERCELIENQTLYHVYNKTKIEKLTSVF